MQVYVRDNNVDQALRALKKKMQREGLFREMKRRQAPQARARRGGAAIPQAVAQAHGARGFLAFVLYHYSPASAGPSFCAWVEAIREISAKSD